MTLGEGPTVKAGLDSKKKDDKHASKSKSLLKDSVKSTTDGKYIIDPNEYFVIPRVNQVDQMQGGISAQFNQIDKYNQQYPLVKGLLGTHQ